MNNSFWQRIKSAWNPSALGPPVVDDEFVHMEGVERAAECWRYNILSFEFWISPNGMLREWLRQVVRLSIPLGAPALLIIPIITFILASPLKLLGSMAWRTIILFVLCLVGVVVTIG